MGVPLMAIEILLLIFRQKIVEMCVLRLDALGNKPFRLIALQNSFFM